MVRSIYIFFGIRNYVISPCRNEDHDTCPICREKLENTDDTWVISDVPNAEEISQEIRTSLMDLAEEKKSTPCTPF